MSECSGERHHPNLITVVWEKWTNRWRVIYSSAPRCKHSSAQQTISLRLYATCFRELLDAFRRGAAELLWVAQVVCIIYQRSNGGGGEPWPACLLPADHYWPSAAHQPRFLSFALPIITFLSLSVAMSLSHLCMHQTVCQWPAFHPEF